VAEIVTELGARYQNVPDDEVRQFLTRLVARRWVELAHG
jgi:pyrroloquinoline quinone biosynthesis protein D